MKHKWFPPLSGLPRLDLSKLLCRTKHSPGEQGDGIDKLYGEVQSCGYQDVHVMWQLLHQSSSEASLSYSLASRALEDPEGEERKGTEAQ